MFKITTVLAVAFGIGLGGANAQTSENPGCGKRFIVMSTKGVTIQPGTILAVRKDHIVRAFHRIDAKTMIKETYLVVKNLPGAPSGTHTIYVWPADWKRIMACLD